MSSQVIAFIGAGRMAANFVGGLVNTGYNPHAIWVSNPTPEPLESLQQSFGIKTTQNNVEAVSKAEVVVLAVKPFIVKTVAEEIASTVQKRNSLIISVATGVPIPFLQSFLGSEVAIVRSMPNLAAFVGCAATALFASKNTDETQRSIAESIMRSIGLAVWLDQESQLDVVTALSGSGPAYLFLFMEAMQATAIEMGLPQALAEILTLQTALGAARMGLESANSLQALREQVTPKGGTTEQAISVFEQGNLRELVARAMQAAKKRAEELSSGQA